jgi:hypothetical protein
MVPLLIRDTVGSAGSPGWWSMHKNLTAQAAARSVCRRRETCHEPPGQQGEAAPSAVPAGGENSADEAPCQPALPTINGVLTKEPRPARDRAGRGSKDRFDPRQAQVHALGCSWAAVLSHPIRRSRRHSEGPAFRSEQMRITPSTPPLPPGTRPCCRGGQTLAGWCE